LAEVIIVATSETLNTGMTKY